MTVQKAIDKVTSVNYSKSPSKNSPKKTESPREVAPRLRRLSSTRGTRPMKRRSTTVGLEEHKKSTTSELDLKKS